MIPSLSATLKNTTYVHKKTMVIFYTPHPIFFPAQPLKNDGKLATPLLTSRWFTFGHQVSGDTAKSLDSRLENPAENSVGNSHMDRGLGGRCVVCVLPASEASTQGPPTFNGWFTGPVMMRLPSSASPRFQGLIFRLEAVKLWGGVIYGWFFLLFFLGGIELKW